MYKKLSNKRLLLTLRAFVVILFAAIWVVTAVGIYYSKHGKTPNEELAVNPLEFSVDVWDGTSSEDSFFSGAQLGNRGDNVYTIDSASAYAYFVDLTQDETKAETYNYFKGYTIYLNSNIDLNGHSVQPIGKAIEVESETISTFQGTFDGAYYSLLNGTISGDGVFGYIENANIQNLGVYNCTIEGNTYAGGLVGTAINSNIENSYVRLGSIKGTNVGGLVGKFVSNNGTHSISNSFVDSTLIGSTSGSLISYADTNAQSTNALTISYCYHTSTQNAIASTSLEGTLEENYITLTEVIRAKNRSQFSTWNYTKTYSSTLLTSQTPVWCDYTYRANSTKLNFNYPLLAGFVKVFLNGSYYESTITLNGTTTSSASLSSAVSLVQANETAEVRIIVEKLYVEEEAVLTSNANLTITPDVNTTLVRGEANQDNLIVSSSGSTLTLGDKLASSSTPTITLDGNRSYVEANNLTCGTLIYACGKDLVLGYNVFLKNNINNTTGYGGALTVYNIKNYNATTNTAEPVILNASVTNCEAAFGGGMCVIGSNSYIGGGASYCHATQSGGGLAILDVSSESYNQQILTNTYLKYGGSKIISTGISSDITQSTIDGGGSSSGSSSSSSGSSCSCDTSSCSCSPNSNSFSNDSADRYGGAICISTKGGVYNICSENIKESSASYGGGGIAYCYADTANSSHSALKLTICCSTIKDCYTENGSGGGVYVSRLDTDDEGGKNTEFDTSDSVKISNSTIDNNHAIYGAGVYLVFVPCSIKDSTISNNGESYTYTDSTNTSRTGYTCSKGGGIYLTNIYNYNDVQFYAKCNISYTTLAINNCTISGNIAGSGGGIWAEHVKCDINNSEIHSNTAIQNNDKYLKTEWEGKGGGIYFTDGSCYIGGNVSDTTIMYNNRSIPLLTGGYEGSHNVYFTCTNGSFTGLCYTYIYVFGILTSDIGSTPVYRSYGITYYDSNYEESVEIFYRSMETDSLKATSFSLIPSFYASDNEKTRESTEGWPINDPWSKDESSKIFAWNTNSTANSTDTDYVVHVPYWKANYEYKPYVRYYLYSFYVDQTRNNDGSFTTLTADNCSFSIHANQWAKAGWTLAGWATSDITFNAIDYDPGVLVNDYVGSTEEVINLYAVASREFKINYNLNGGTGISSVDFTQYGAVYQSSDTYCTGVTLPTPTRVGYTFLNWSITINGSTKTYKKGDTFTPSYDVKYPESTESNGTFTLTFDAVWQHNDITVEVNFYNDCGYPRDECTFGNIPIDASSITINSNTSNFTRFTASIGSTSKTFEWTIYPYFDSTNVSWSYKLDSGVNYTISGNSISISLSNVDSTITITISATARSYSLPMMYFTSDGSFGEIDQPYTYLSDDIKISENKPTEAVQEVNGKAFGAWMIKYSGSGNNITIYSATSPSTATGYTGSLSGNTLTIKNGSNGSWSFHVTDTISNLNGTYYMVDTLLSGSWGEIGTPFITARWSNTYKVTLTNDGTQGTGSNIWDNLSDSTKTAYYGVGGSWTNSTNGNKTSDISLWFTLRYGTNYTYNFMSTNNLAFYQRSDMTTVETSKISHSDAGSFYVFNYGYKITGYYIMFVYLGTTYYLVYDGSSWEYKTPQQTTQLYSTIENLTSGSTSNMNNMAAYAETLDELLAGGLVATQEITMLPVWDPVTIYITVDNTTTISTAKFGNTYSTASYTVPSLGKSLAYFTTSSGEYILPSSGDIPYTYYTLSYNQYSYNTSSGTYTLSVTPYKVDNIYQVQLYMSSINTDSSGGYTLTKDCGYSFSNASGMQNYYTFKDESGYKTWSESSYKFATDYANAVQGVVSTYESAISNGTHDLLNKVYVSGGSFTNEESPSASGVSAMYIYLANGQKTGRKTGDLPVFDTPYKTLIFWISNANTSTEAKAYAYVTNQYDSTKHSIPEEYEQHRDVTAGYWYLKDNYTDDSTNGSTTYTITFNAYYFRKMYDLTMTTKLDGIVGQYGYVVLNIADKSTDANTDADKSGTYLAIYTNGKMRYYDITEVYSAIQELDSSFTLANLTLGDNSLTYTLNGSQYTCKAVEHIYFYIGCDLNIYAYDQSRDTAAMLTGKYLDQIGYKFNSLTSSQDIFNFDSAYFKPISAEDIEALDLANNSIISLTANYEKIAYSIGVEMRTGNTSGSFSIIDPDGIVYSYLTSTTLTDLTVGDIIQITYNAYAGYEFDNIAFSLKLPNRDEILLLPYCELKDNGKILSQTYTLTLNAEWLLKNYYDYTTYHSEATKTNSYNSFSTADTNLGTVSVNTTEIEYEYYVKLIDGATSQELTNISIDSAWKLSTGTVALATITETGTLTGAFIYNGDMCYVVKVGDKYYAAVYSYAYLPKNPTYTGNYYTTYEFLLKEQPTTTYSISTNLLAIMTQHTTYEILPQSLRQIYMALVVREIVRIDYKIEEVTHDPYLTKTVTLSNGTDNTTSLTVTSDYTLTGHIYTYVGLTNRISLSYDENAYTGATYTYNDVEVSNNFTVDTAGTLKIYFTPKPVPVSIEYYINDTQTTLSGISNLLSITTVYANELYYCQESSHTDGQITITFTQKDGDFDLYIYVNSVNLASSYTVNNQEVLTYSVTQNDVKSGKIQICIKEVEHNNDVVTIEYALIDSKLAVSGDDYGTYTIRINQVAQTDTSVTVHEGNKLELQLNLNTGYEYYGLMHNNDSITQPDLSNNTLTLSTSFKTNEGGRYRVYLTKTTLNATLNITGDTHKTYALDTTLTANINKTISQDKSVYTLTNIYVGKELTLTRTQIDVDEQLNYYYYYNKYNTMVEIQPDENGTANLEITSDLLESIAGDLAIYVSTTPKYKVDLVVSGSIYLENLTELQEMFKDNGEYVYFTEGETIHIQVISTVEGKINVSVSLNLARDNIETDADISYNQTTGYPILTGDRVEADLTITNDLIIYISLSPKEFAVNVDEYLYDTLDELNDVPKKVEADSLETSGQSYGAEATIKIPTTKDQKQLYTITLTSETHSWTLNLETGEITASRLNQETNEWEETTYTYRDGTLTLDNTTYTLTATENILTLNYVTSGDITLTLTYKSEKAIQPSTGE